MMLKAKCWLEMISATAMKKDQTKTKSAGRAHMVKILWTPVTPFWYRLNGADMKIFLVKKPRSNEAQSNDFNGTNWSLHPWDCRSTDKKQIKYRQNWLEPVILINSCINFVTNSRSKLQLTMLGNPNSIFVPKKVKRVAMLDLKVSSKNFGWHSLVC